MFSQNPNGMIDLSNLLSAQHQRKFVLRSDRKTLDRGNDFSGRPPFADGHDVPDKSFPFGTYSIEFLKLLSFGDGRIASHRTNVDHGTPELNERSSTNHYSRFVSTAFSEDPTRSGSARHS